MVLWLLGIEVLLRVLHLFTKQPFLLVVEIKYRSTRRKRFIVCYVLYLISLSSAETSLYRREGWRVGKKFSVIAIFIGIRSGSLCEGERPYIVTPWLPLLPDRSQIKVSGNCKRVTSKGPEQRGGRWGRGYGKMSNSVSVWGTDIGPKETHSSIYY